MVAALSVMASDHIEQQPCEMVLAWQKEPFSKMTLFRMCVVLSSDQPAKHGRNSRFMVSAFRRREQFIGIISPVRRELVCR